MEYVDVIFENDFPLEVVDRATKEYIEEVVIPRLHQRRRRWVCWEGKDYPPDPSLSGAGARGGRVICLRIHTVPFVALSGTYEARVHATSPREAPIVLLVDGHNDLASAAVAHTINAYLEEPREP